MGSSKHTPEGGVKVILSEHDTREEALAQEIEYHTIHDVKLNDQYYNKSNQTSSKFDTTGTRMPRDAVIQAVKTRKINKQKFDKDMAEKVQKAGKSTDLTSKKDVLRLPIPGTKGYIIDLFTHEIFNAEGKKMKSFIDGRGRVSIKLVATGGKRKVYIVKDVAKKLHISLREEKQTASMSETDVMMNRIEEIIIIPKGLERYEFCKGIFPNIDYRVIKQFLSYLK